MTDTIALTSAPVDLSTLVVEIEVPDDVIAQGHHAVEAWLNRAAGLVAFHLDRAARARLRNRFEPPRRPRGRARSKRSRAASRGDGGARVPGDGEADGEPPGAPPPAPDDGIDPGLSDCPSCGAPPGEPCLTPLGHPLKTNRGLSRLPSGRFPPLRPGFHRARRRAVTVNVWPWTEILA